MLGSSGTIEDALSCLTQLQLLDCGYCLRSECEDDTEHPSYEHPSSAAPLILQASSPSLKQLSLWGCSALKGIQLECPHLSEMNLNSCTGLSPEHSKLSCPELKTIFTEGVLPEVRECVRCVTVCVWC